MYMLSDIKMPRFIQSIVDGHCFEILLIGNFATVSILGYGFGEFVYTHHIEEEYMNRSADHKGCACACVAGIAKCFSK